MVFQSINYLNWENIFILLECTNIINVIISKRKKCQTHGTRKIIKSMAIVIAFT